MINRNNKKGFTIVELVIVIAVIAILAAVLIPTFSGIIKRANLSADEQAIRQMNTALAVYEAENGKPKDIIAAKKALDEALVNVEGGLVPVTQGYAFYWDSVNNKVVLVGGDVTVQDSWELLSNSGFGETFDVDTVEKLEDAIARSSKKNPAIIKFTADLTLEEKLSVKNGSTVTFDLNGKTLTTKAQFAVAANSVLTIKDGKIKNDNPDKITLYNAGGTLALDNVEVTGPASAGKGNWPAIYVAGICDTSIKDSKIFAAGSYAIATNSSEDESDGARIVIENSEITTTNTPAIMVSITADIKMDNCTVTGTTHAMVLHCATANITNTTFKSTESDSGHTDVGQGASCPAAAVAVMAHGSAQNYGNNGNYTFENCTFDSASAVDVFANSYDANCTLVVNGIGDAAVNAEATRGAGKTTINK